MTSPIHECRKNTRTRITRHVIVFLFIDANILIVRQLPTLVHMKIVSKVLEIHLLLPTMFFYKIEMTVNGLVE